MKARLFSSITKLTLLVLLLVGITSTYNFNTNPILATTATQVQNYGPEKPTEVNQQSQQPDCEGLWVNSDATKKIYLNAIYLKDWAANSNPSLILDTYEKITNYLIIGHNICLNGMCNAPRSQFANIMKLKEGDKVSACIGGILYSGYIFTSGPIPDTRTEVMRNWTGFKTITMFTSYGKCKDSICTSTDKRWMVAFERDK